MKKQTILKSIYFPTMLVVLLFMASVSMASDFKPVSSKARGVRVDVAPVQLAAGQATRFEVRLDTHSVTLDQDLTAVAVLRDNQGREYKTVQWDGDPRGVHHRKGVLVFAKLTAPLTSVTLTLREVAGVPTRDFTWQLKP